MKQSESIKELATALCLAQAAMGGAVKESKNPFFKSSYADLTSVIKVVKEPFADNGLSFVQLPVSGETYVGVTTMLMHTSGEWLQSEYMLPMTKRDPQAAGSTITYARRYALQSLVGIPSVDDDSELAMFRGGTPANTEPDMSLEEANIVYNDLATKHSKTIECVKAGIESGEITTAAEAWFELTEDEQMGLWKAYSKGGVFTTEEQKLIRTTEFKEAYFGKGEAA